MFIEVFALVLCHFHHLLCPLCRIEGHPWCLLGWRSFSSGLIYENVWHNESDNPVIDLRGTADKLQQYKSIVPLPAIVVWHMLRARCFTQTIFF